MCSNKATCTRDRARSVSYHIYEDSINKARQLNKTEQYRISQRMRKKIEELFGEAKEFMGLRQAKFRGATFLKEQVLMTAVAQNVKRMVKLLSRGGTNKGAIAAHNSTTLSFIKNLYKMFTWLFQNNERILSGTRDCFAII